jgi:hypothetical protein
VRQQHWRINEMVFVTRPSLPGGAATFPQFFRVTSFIALGRTLLQCPYDKGRKVAKIVRLLEIRRFLW